MKARDPSWGRLYLITSLLIGLLGLVEVEVPAGAWRRTVEAILCVVTFGAMHLWVRANRIGLDMLGERDHRLRQAVDEPAATVPPGHGRNTRIRSPRGARLPAPRAWSPWDIRRRGE